MADKSQIDQINPYIYSKILIPHKISKRIDEKNKSLKIKSSLIKRQLPRVKSALLFETSKDLKKLAISSKSYSQFMKVNEKYNKLKDSYYTNRQRSSYIIKENDIGTQSQRTTKKSLPHVFYIKPKTKDNINLFRKSSCRSSKDLRTYDLKKIEKKNIIINYDSNINNNEEDNNTIKEMPYGFKYKDTKIIIDKNKLNNIKSTIISDEKVEYSNITELKRRKSFEEKSKKKFKKVYTTKKEEEKNETFKYFFEGDFLQTKKNLFNDKKKKLVMIKNEEAIDYLNELYTICKKMEKFNGRDVTRKMKFNLKRYCNKDDFSFELNLRSLCLKFIKQNNNINKEQKIKSQKLYLPFTYLLFFYLLDFETFKIFLSEILIYNEQNDEMEINQKEIRNLLVKYKNYVQVYLGPLFNDKTKNNVKENIEKLAKITYNCNERNFIKIYDWIIHNNPSTEKENVNISTNKNIIYKVQIILPSVKFNLFTPKVEIKKHIHKNIIIKLLKTGLVKWEEKILCDLFFNKRFRYIMNSITSPKDVDYYVNNTKKYFLDSIDYKVNTLNKHKYEFFITDAKKEYTKYLYISSYEILFFYGREKDKFFYKKDLNLKDSINLNKYSDYWGYMNTVMKCLYVDKSLRKANFDFKILENSPTKFFKLKLDNKLNFNDSDKNNIDNLKNFYNQGFMLYHSEDLLIDFYLINFILVQPCIIRINYKKYYYKIPKELLNIITKNINSYQKMNLNISEFSESILMNKGILNINYDDLKSRVYHLNLGKKSQERLKTFTMGIINKTSTFKHTASDNKLSKFKRGISTGFGSLFGKSLLNSGNNYQKSNTKKFGGSISINMQKIKEKNTFHSKKDISRISVWKKLASKKVEEKVENKEENKEINDFNPINLIPTQEENVEEEVITKTESFGNKNRRISKFTENAEFFKGYIRDNINKGKK